jgi:hypothetical protein
VVRDGAIFGPSQKEAMQTGKPAENWTQIGTRILDAARLATAVHLARTARQTAMGGVAEASPGITQGG